MSQHQYEPMASSDMRTRRGFGQGGAQPSFPSGSGPSMQQYGAYGESYAAPQGDVQQSTMTAAGAASQASPYAYPPKQDGYGGYASTPNPNSTGRRDDVLSSGSAKVGFSIPANLRYSFAILLATACFLHADQNLAAPNLSAIARDFEMSDVSKDTQLGGVVQFGFFLIGGACSVFIGPLADRLDRSLLLAIVVIAGSVPCLLTWWIPSSASGFYWFFLARVATGISIGGSFPVLYSLCGDLFPSSQRSYIAACVGAACNIGAALGGVMAGIIGPVYGWRLPFVVVSIPCIALAISLKLTLKDPRMKDKLETKSVEWVNAWAGGRAVDPNAISAGYISIDDLDLKKFKRVNELPTNRWVFMQALPGCIPIAVIVTFLSDYLSTEMQMDVRASTGITAVFGISCLFFSLYGGSVGQRLWESDKNAFCNLVSGAMACAVVPFLLLLNLPTYWISVNGSPTLTSYVLAAAGGVMAAAGPNIRAVLLNVNAAEVRGTVFSAFTLCDDIGKGFGPTIVVMLRSILGRRAAFSVAFCFWFLSAYFLHNIRYSLGVDSKKGGNRFDRRQ